MGLREAASSFGGGNISEAFNFLFIDSEVIEAQKQTASQQEQIVRDQYNNGTISKNESDEILSEIGQTQYPVVFEQHGSPLDAFTESIDSGVQTARTSFSKIINGTVGTIFTGVPIQIWIALAAYVAFRMFLARKVFA